MKIFFHLGYPRTGTTFLQKNLFSKSKKINFIGRKSNYGRQDKFFYHSLFQIIDLNNKQYKKKKSEILSSFKKIYFSKKKTNIISEEGISCQYSWKNNDMKRTLRRLIEIKKKSKLNISFFMTIRNQQECLISNFQFFYSFYFHKYYPNFDYLIKSRSLRTKKILDSFNYYEIFKIFKNSDEKINFIIYEELSSNPNKFIIKLSNYLNLKLKLNNSLSSKINSKNDLSFKYKITSEKIKNLLNFSKFPSKIKNVNSIFKRIYLDNKINNIKITQKNKDKIKFYFKSDNKKLNNSIKLTKNYF